MAHVRKRSLLPEVSADTALLVYRVAYCGLILGAVLVLASTLLTFWSDNELKRHDDMWRKAKEAEISSANESAAKANERAAELDARAKEAELKLEQLRKLVGPRTLQPAPFLEQLKDRPKASVQIWFLEDASDAWQLAFTLSALLHQAGWEVTEQIPVPEPDRSVIPPGKDTPRVMAAGGQPSGVTVVTRESDPGQDSAFQALIRALGHGMEGPVMGSSSDMRGPEMGLRVVIAAKPDPIFPKEEKAR